jgi:Cof subfamily protein (haloacid dehalogenase superfamily)
MNYTLLALDIDGTLANSQKQISDKNVEVLYKAQEAGVKVALVSGRPTYGILPTAKRIGLDHFGGYVLSFNGAKIIEYNENMSCLYENTLETKHINEIYTAAKEYGVEMISYSSDAILTENPEYIYIQKEATLNNMPTAKVKHLAEAINFNVPKCLLLSDPEYLAKVEQEMKLRFPELSIYRSEPYFLEIMPQNIDKAFSLDILLKELSMKREKLMACGDGFNDLSMIQYAGLGVAMQNAQQVVKDSADYVSHLTNDEDAVAHVIEKFVL